MRDNTRKEIVRELELDYEKTTKAIEGVVSKQFHDSRMENDSDRRAHRSHFPEQALAALANRPPPGISSSCNVIR
jgi:hypothetical protein